MTETQKLREALAALENANALSPCPMYLDGGNLLREVISGMAQSEPDERDKVDAWQPIETAPKWESILIYQPKFNRVAISLNDGFEYKHATHWMPLPPPPIDAAIAAHAAAKGDV